MVEHMLVHDNRLVQELPLLQTDPETCQEEIGVTLLAHSGTYVHVYTHKCITVMTMQIMICKRDAYNVLAHKVLQKSAIGQAKVFDSYA